MAIAIITGIVRGNVEPKTPGALPPPIPGAQVNHVPGCGCQWNAAVDNQGHTQIQVLGEPGIKPNQITNTNAGGNYSLKLWRSDLINVDVHPILCQADWYYGDTQNAVVPAAAPTAKPGVTLNFLLQPVRLTYNGRVFVTVGGVEKPIEKAVVYHSPTCGCGYTPGGLPTYINAAFRDLYKRRVKTGADGRYSLYVWGRNPQVATHTIICEVPGRPTQTLPFTVDQAENADFEFDPLPSDMPEPEDENDQGALPHGDHGEEGEEIAHACGFPNISAPGFCDRPTTNAGYCYQHAKYNKDKRVAFAGTWRMNGVQTNVPRSHWEASLLLRANGTLSWKETKGANVGARRAGTWKFDGKTLTMKYKAPQVGLVVWTTNAVSPTDMSGIYRTPQVDPKGAGWGGDWSAHKLKTPKKTVA